MSEQRKKVAIFVPFVRKYFWEGQQLNDSPSPPLVLTEKLLLSSEIVVDDNSSFDEIFVRKHRKLIGTLLPTAIFLSAWLCLAIRYDLFALFADRYVMSLVMIFGAMIGGMTTEGGGAVAFPVMTLLLKIEPTIARDFSIMIQSCGLTAASFTIFFMGIVVEWRSIVCSTCGAVFGLIFGFHCIDPYMQPAHKKMAFVAIFFSFALALFLLNAQHKRRTFSKIQNFRPWTAAVLIANGFVGGIFTSFVGSGIDVYSFSILTLLFRVSEKVATPTSVILMSFNSIVGFFWRQLIMPGGGISSEAWKYFAVCMPVVVTFAPIGSLCASHFHRLTLASMIYALETVALVGGFAVVRPDLALSTVTIGIIGCAFVFYYALSKIGARMAAAGGDEQDIVIVPIISNDVHVVS